MRNMDKRIHNLGADMSAPERVLAALDAITADDDSTLDWLKKTAPHKSYTATDGAYSDTMNAAHHVALHFDRAFYKGMVEATTVIAAQLIAMPRMKDVTDEERPALADQIERLETRADDLTDTLTVLAVGLETFAHRIGIDLHRLMALSLVLDLDADAFERYRNPPDGTTERLADDISGVADNFAAIWRRCGPEVLPSFRAHAA
ncbi:hypothetical protein [uncultured Rhodospira sp.]|uniref:hypothetical protein n=1 Tax=uncultured Rhodospira sp. TaxID=1936189 RepID=UPI002631255E|nr:hypothetical protein [uncultured Rhodospira sp.]